jgi:hypothetical protein
VDIVRRGHKHRINLVQHVVNDDESSFDEFQRDSLNGLRLLLDSASDITKAIDLFQVGQCWLSHSHSHSHAHAHSHSHISPPFSININANAPFLLLFLSCRCHPL